MSRGRILDHSTAATAAARLLSASARGARAAWPPGIKWAGPLGIALCIAAADAGGNAWARRHLPLATTGWSGGGVVEMAKVFNRRASFGLGADHPNLVMAAGMVGVALAAWWLVQTRSAGERIPVVVLLGGAVANLGERIATGAVTDWIHVWGYSATFNPADVCIRGGLIAAVVLRWRRHRRPGRRGWPR